MSPANRKRSVVRPGLRALRALSRRALERVRPHPIALYSAISTRPVVLFVQDWSIGGTRSPLMRLLRRLGERRVHVYYNTSWHVDQARVLPFHLERLGDLARRFSNTRTTVLAQTPEELALFETHGVRSVYCNQNALADERVFRVLDGVEKRHDAVYDARLDRFKRHALARDVERLALVTYLNSDTDRTFARKVATRLAHATWLNGPPDPGVRLLSAEEVNRAYNASRVGLCLSEREGAMWASIQYLLAGLPIVSTPSEGGRDEFFDPDYVRIVEPTAESIARAVAEVCAARLDPLEIRRRTLERVAEHRRRFVEHVQAVLDEEGETRRFEHAWPHVFRHRMVDATLSGRSKSAEIQQHDDAIVAAVTRGDPYPSSPSSLRDSTTGA